MQASRWAQQNDEDAFAQTREPDNLFDDDITPILEPIVQPLPAAEQPARQYTPNQRARGNGRARGRARGGLTASPRRQDSVTPQSHESKPTPPPQVAPLPTEPSNLPVEETSEAQPQPQAQDQLSDVAAEPGTPGAVAKVQAVRGPRHQTGGVVRPKLTEDELSARMAAAALNNAKREAAHKEAEADAAKFEAREAAAKQRRVQDSAARRVMDNERERNRQRKLGARGGREWDQGKDEKQLSGAQERRGYRPGAHGGVVSVEIGYENSNNGLISANREDNNRDAVRGRGRGRGRGQRGRGRGRGGFDGSLADIAPGDSAAPSLGEDHFPTLSTNTKPSDSSSTNQSSVPLMSPIADKGTWADQVEASQ